MAKVKKTPVTVLSTDWHLKPSNLEEIKSLVREKCELAISLNINTVFGLGDIFNSRSGQTVEILNAFGEILEIFREFKITFWAIPGNHDKMNYFSDESFLDPFKYHPNFKLINKAGGFPLKGVMLHLLPYYKSEMWIEKFDELMLYLIPFEEDHDNKHILLSHIAVNGSINNDGSKVECGIAVSDFKYFDSVLLGHYHNQHQVGTNVFHIPSITQHNFGENEKKGFTVLYDDGSFELVKSGFKPYKKIVIDANLVSKAELAVLMKENTDSKHYVRFEFVGTSDSLKTINKEALNALGIDVKMKVKEIEDTIEYAETEIKEHDTTSIKEEFLEFCNEKDYDFEEGMSYLSKKLK